MITALCERWHDETSSFYMSMGKMTITLDDVVCLLHVFIEGRMMNHAKRCLRMMELKMRKTQEITYGEGFGDIFEGVELFQ